MRPVLPRSGSTTCRTATSTVNQSGVSRERHVVANPQGSITIVTTGNDVISFQGTTPNKRHLHPGPARQPARHRRPAGRPRSCRPTSVEHAHGEDRTPAPTGPGVYLTTSTPADPCTMSTGLYVFAGQFDHQEPHRQRPRRHHVLHLRDGDDPDPDPPCSSSGEVGGSIQQAGTATSSSRRRHRRPPPVWRSSPTATTPTTVHPTGQRRHRDEHRHDLHQVRDARLPRHLRLRRISTRWSVTGNMTFSGQAPVVITYTEQPTYRVTRDQPAAHPLTA